MLVCCCAAEEIVLPPSNDEIAEGSSVSASLELVKSERIWLDWRSASACHLAKSALPETVNFASSAEFDVAALAWIDVLLADIPDKLERVGATDELCVVAGLADDFVVVVPDGAGCADADDDAGCVL